MIQFQAFLDNCGRPLQWCSAVIVTLGMLHLSVPTSTAVALSRSIETEQPVHGALDVGDIDPSSAGVSVRETWELEGHRDQWVELVGVGDPLLTPTVLELFDPAGLLLVEERWYLPPNSRFAVVGLGSILPSDGSYQIVLSGLERSAGTSSNSRGIGDVWP